MLLVLASRSLLAPEIALLGLLELARLGELPGVTAVGATRLLPLTGTIGDWSITLEGRDEQTTPVRDIMTSPFVYVSPEASIDECMAIMTARRVAELVHAPRDAESNMVVECFAIHVRCLDDFLWASRSDRHEQCRSGDVPGRRGERYRGDCKSTAFHSRILLRNGGPV